MTSHTAPRGIFHFSLALGTLTFGGAIPTMPGARADDAASQNAARPKNLFPLAQGRIQYRLTTTDKVPSRGTATLTWLEHGRRFRQQRRIVTQSPTGQPPKSITWIMWVIADEKKIDVMLPTPVMPGQKHRVVREQRPVDLSNEYSNMLFFVPPADLVMGKISGHGMVLGKLCTLYTLIRKEPLLQTDSNLWIWEGIVLRREKTTRQTVSGGTPGKPKVIVTKETAVATNLNTNVRPSPDLFRVPAGYRIKEIKRLPAH